ncbi:MAG TPA: LpqB family beta-propeller domain-containing protein, partial [Gemmatimonadales bacterium]|nr:LpqB family beta-propeller domain-containing protein [Gemmatimonadales bacterium]
LLWGSWSPGGRSIAYTDRDTLFTQVIGEDRRVALATGAGVHSPTWSPDGKWIAFVEGNALFHVNGNTAFSAIRLVRAAGGKPVQVTDASALNTSPVWVPGEHALLFISDREGGRDIYQVALGPDGLPRSTPLRLTTGLNAERLAISADGRRLAWSVFTATSNAWSLPVTPQEPLPLSKARQLTREAQRVEGISISPDRAWLYYGSDRSGNPDLWRMRLAGGEPEQLTAEAVGEFAPAVSPDGSEVAFHSQRNGNRDIFIMPAAGGPTVQVSSSSGEEAAPAWSPDGRALIWVDGDTIRIARRNRGGSWEKPVALLSAPDVGAPQWSPDGRWISYSLHQAGGGAGGQFELFDVTTGTRRSLPGAAGVFWHAWSGDARVIFGATADTAGASVIVAVPLTGVRSRVVAFADQPLSQEIGLGLAVSGRRLYFPLVERKADVWVGEVTHR